MTNPDEVLLAAKETLTKATQTLEHVSNTLDSMQAVMAENESLKLAVGQSQQQVMFAQNMINTFHAAMKQQGKTDGQWHMTAITLEFKARVEGEKVELGQIQVKPQSNLIIPR